MRGNILYTLFYSFGRRCDQPCSILSRTCTKIEHVDPAADMGTVRRLIGNIRPLVQGTHTADVGADGTDLGQGHDLKTGYREGIAEAATVPILEEGDVQGYVYGCDALILRPA